MRRPFSLLVVAGMLTACAETASLKPAPAARTVPGPGPATTVETVAGVSVQVTPKDWPGDLPISEKVTPLKVNVSNNGNSRILIRYSEIRLVVPGGRTYAALPPQRIDAMVSVPTMSPGYRPIARPGFRGTGFGVAPLYSPMYPGYPVAADPFPYDPTYYGHYGRAWETVELPTDAMLERALPEGSLEPGGSLEGYLYFEKVEPDVSRVRFRMDLLNAGQGKELGTVEIPFLVE
jgi:hypothetical protein